MNFNEWMLQFDVCRAEVDQIALAAKNALPTNDVAVLAERSDAIEHASSFPRDRRVFYRMLQRRVLEQIHEARRRDPSDRCDMQCVAYNQASTEASWCEQGTPYCKLYPDVARMLTESDISVPANLVHAPLSAICLRLPEDHGIDDLRAGEANYLRAVLVVEAAADEVVRASEALSGGAEARRFIFWFDFGENVDDDSLVVVNRRLPVVSFQVVAIEDEDASFETNLTKWLGHRRLDWERGIDISDDVLLAAVRMSLGACLLMTGADQVVEADVLSKHASRYRNASSDAEKSALHQKAIKRGKHGWLLGREISVPSRHVESSSSGEGRGRALQHSHLRRGHFHTVRYGEGRKESKVKWYRPVIVRSDLPAPSTVRGYKSVSQ